MKLTVDLDALTIDEFGDWSLGDEIKDVVAKEVRDYTRKRCREEMVIVDTELSKFIKEHTRAALQAALDAVREMDPKEVLARRLGLGELK